MTRAPRETLHHLKPRAVCGRHSCSTKCQSPAVLLSGPVLVLQELTEPWQYQYGLTTSSAVKDCQHTMAAAPGTCTNPMTWQSSPGTQPGLWALQRKINQVSVLPGETTPILSTRCFPTPVFPSWALPGPS